MGKSFLIATGLVWPALTGAASAGVTLTPGPMDPQYFAGEAAHQNGFTINGMTWSNVSGVAETEKGSLASVYAAPLGMGTNQTTRARPIWPSRVVVWKWRLSRRSRPASASIGARSMATP